MTDVYKIDAAKKKLGRVATEASMALMGKNRPDFANNVLTDVEVVIENASLLDISDTKKEKKVYLRHTGFPGGQRSENLQKVIDKKGYEEVLKRAVRGMLPKNKLRAPMLKNLKVID